MTNPLKQSNESSEDNVQKLEEKVEKPQEIIPKNRCSKQERKAYPLSEIALWKSQYFIQRILETTPNLVYIYDAIAKTTIYANGQFAEMLGYISEETVPIAVDFLPSLLHPDDVGKVSEQFKRFQDATDSQIFEIEYRIKHKNGEWRWFKSRETVFARTSGGLPYQILGIAEDITERKWVEEALRESERHLRTIFDHTFQFTGLLKPDGTLLEVNQTALDFSGQQRSDIVNHPFWDARWWAISRETQKQLRRAIATAGAGKFVRYEVDIKGTGDAVITIDFSLKPFKDETGQVVLLIAEGRDISDSLKESSASRRQVKALLAGQNHILEAIAKGAKLGEVLGKIAQLIEHQLPQTRCSFLLLDKNGVKLRHGAAPSLPDSYNQVLDGLTIGPFVGSCGAAAYWGETVIVKDIAVHPLWADCRDLALSHGLFACWSAPIFSTTGKVLGTFAMYYGEPRTPTRHEQDLTAKATQLARIAIERSLAQQELLRSNAMLKAQQEAAIDGILVIDEQGQIASYNQRFWELWQIPESFIQSSDESGLRKCLLSKLKHPQEFLDKVEYLYAHPNETDQDELTLKDGRIIEFYSAPVPSPLGSYYGRIWYSRDITERKQAEADLRQTKEKYRKLIESAGDAIIAVDAETGTILEANQMAEKILGRSRNEIISLHQTEIHPSEQLEPYTEMFEKLLEVGDVFQAEVELRHKDGMTVPVEVRATAVEVQGKKIIQGIFRDIRDRKQTEKELREAKVAAEAANRAKSEFLANMSHELRTPLNGILGYAQILKRELTLSFRQQEQVNIIQQCGEHLLTLLNDILDLSKIEAQKMELHLSDFPFPYFLDSLVEIFRLRAEQKNIFFKDETLSALPQCVRGDEKRLRQVLINLLGNAIKFTDTGGVTFKVGYVMETKESLMEQESSLTGDGETENQLPITNYQLSTRKMRFVVQDTGIGMASDRLAEIFLPFHQIGDSRHHVEGTGLGLAISQKLVQLMGGELRVKSTLDQGSVFWFDVDLPEVLEEIEATPDLGKIVGVKGEKCRVLVVDDKWENRAVLVDLLSPLGFEVVEATGGQDCLDRTLEIQPDVILLDMIMPGMNGFETTRRLRQLPNLKKVIVIATSASAFADDKEQCLAAGCDGFISKPVEAEKLLQQLHHHLGLEWIYQEERLSSEVGKDNLQSTKLTCQPVAPPAEKIAVLHKLAMMGDIRGIQEQANAIEQLDERFVPFAQQLRQLAKGFQEKQILEFVRKYMAGSE